MQGKISKKKYHIEGYQGCCNLLTAVDSVSAASFVNCLDFFWRIHMKVSTQETFPSEINKHKCLKISRGFSVCGTFFFGKAWWFNRWFNGWKVSSDFRSRWNIMAEPFLHPWQALRVIGGLRDGEYDAAVQSNRRVDQPPGLEFIFLVLGVHGWCMKRMCSTL